VGVAEWTLVGMTAISVLFAVIGWLISRSVDANEKSVELLFKKHDSDVGELQKLREMVIGQHYRRDELDVKFEKLDDTFKSGFRDMGDKLDKLTTTLISHLGEHTGSYPKGTKP
jgi:hypothetical protein